MSDKETSGYDIFGCVSDDQSTYRERFIEKVDIRGEDECWEWTAATVRRGYGAIHSPDGRWKRAHRVAYMFEYGGIDGDQVNHHCDNTSCVNPKHLYAGDQSENIRDAVKRGRWDNNLDSEGVKKLEDQEAKEIRMEYDRKQVTQKELAERYGVHRTTISKIVRGESYTNTQ